MSLFNSYWNKRGGTVFFLFYINFKYAHTFIFFFFILAELYECEEKAPEPSGESSCRVRGVGHFLCKLHSFFKPLCISFLISKERKINIPLILIKGKQASIHFVFNFCYIFFSYIPNSITKKKIYYVLICLLIHVIGLYPVGLPWHEAQGGCEGGGWTFDVQPPLHWEEGGRHPGGGYRNPGESPMRG